MSNNPLISVITTVKNASEFLKETLESVYDQSYKNYEHIIVDDGSDDKTVAIIKDFKIEFQDNKIKLMITKGIGRAKALNLGVSNAEGQWIAIIDGDDLWHPKKLEYQVENIGPGVDVLCTGSILFSETKNVMYNLINYTKLVAIERKAFLRSNQISHSSVILRKSLCRYDVKRLSQLDYELWLRLISNDSVLYKIEEFLSFHRIHKNQTYEGKMGNGYRYRSFKLKFYYSYKFKDITSMGFNLLKLIFDILFPRKLRLQIRKRYNG